MCRHRDIAISRRWLTFIQPIRAFNPYRLECPGGLCVRTGALSKNWGALVAALGHQCLQGSFRVTGRAGATSGTQNKVILFYLDKALVCAAIEQSAAWFTLQVTAMSVLEWPPLFHQKTEEGRLHLDGIDAIPDMPD